MGLRAAIPLSGILFVAFLAGRSMADDRVVPLVAPVNTTNGIALKGYDPVAYFTTGKPIPGTVEFSSSWNGVTYRFASGTNLHLFAADPEKYAPQYGGYCAYAISINRIADIDPSEWAIVDQKLYLNNNTFSQALWSLNKHSRIVSGDRNWAALPKTHTDNPANEGSVP